MNAMNGTMVPTESRKDVLSTFAWGATATSIETIVVACAIGLALPAYYDWSGADQSRPSPWIPLAGAVLALLATLIAACLGVRHYYWHVPSAARIQNGWYPLIIAVGSLPLLAGLQTIGGGAVGGILSFVVLAVVIGLSLYQAYRFARVRWPLAALIAASYGPFLWLFFGKYTGASPEAFLFVSGAPMLLPAGYTGMFLGMRLQELLWLDNGFTAIALAMGIALIHLGEKRALAYTLFMLVIAAAGSMAFHSMIRA